jgi:hypothetical protein
MHGFLLKGSDEYLSSYAGWQKGYSKKQTERGARWSDLIKRSPVAYEKSSTLKKLVRKGIPNYLRGRVWMEVPVPAPIHHASSFFAPRLVDCGIMIRRALTIG